VQIGPAVPEICSRTDTHTHTERERETDTDKHTDRQTAQTDRNTPLPYQGGVTSRMSSNCGSMHQLESRRRCIMMFPLLSSLR